MPISIPFNNSYATLPERFYARTLPTPVPEPELISINSNLAAELGIDADALASDAGLAMLAGNEIPEGADPLAQVYAGHQFGGWSPQLGDGRAILLGELLDINNISRDLQLKGAGRTPYSRGGDGRAWLGPVLREYVVSEAMHALGIPTTRALAAVETGETVYREGPMPGAVITRVASSHIRVGTFQYLISRQDIEGLQALTDYVIRRHYPSADNALELLEGVITRHVDLVTRWMGVGFIHGVMNTDNSHIAGDTIDYGPCAFMDIFHPNQVFSSIDRHGRYAYSNQPDITVWNMAQLATALLPLIDADRDRAVELATKAVHRFPDLFKNAWLGEFRAKLGLVTEQDGDQELIEDLLSHMATRKLDFTNTFRDLSTNQDIPKLAEWHAKWNERLTDEPADAKDRMCDKNPAVIPRNHQIEAMIQAAVRGDFEPFHKLNRVLATPFTLAEEDNAYRSPPEPHEVVKETFCGT